MATKQYVEFSNLFNRNSHLDEIREKTLMGEETYSEYVDEHIRSFDKEDRRVRAPILCC